MQNTYCEGEGAAVGFIVRSYLQENVVVVSNDNDAFFYCMIAASKRDHISNEFSHEFWLKIVYTSNTTRLIGLKNNRVS